MILRAVGLVTTTLLGLVLAYGTLLAHPEPLFAHQLAYRNFRVYSRDPLDPRLQPILDTVAVRLAASPLNDPTMIHRIFVLGSPSWNAFFNGPYQRAMGRRYEIGGSIFVPTIDLARGDVVHFDGRRARAVWILTHEATHSLVARRVGPWREMHLPRWKREGYPEYVASGHPISLRDGVALLDQSYGSAIPVGGGYQVPRSYFEDQMLVTYVLDVRGWTVDQLFADTVERDGVERDLRAWETER
jgi:hypothetical protein